MVALSFILMFNVVLNIDKTDAASKKISLKLSSGATYYGEVKNGKPHGKGTARWGENKTYSGDWVNGKRSGYGVYKLNGNGESVTYTGNWKNDKQNGQGNFISKATEEYGMSRIQKGTFVNNQFKSGNALTVYFDSYYQFSHEDDDKYIHFMTFKENVNKVLSGKRGNSLITQISYYKKKANGLFEGYRYGYEPESSGASYSVGTYKKVTEAEYSYFNLYNGVNDSFEELYYLKEKYTSGRLSKAEKIDDIDEFFTTLDNNLAKRLPDMKPYLKTFTTLKNELK